MVFSHSLKEDCYNIIDKPLTETFSIIRRRRNCASDLISDHCPPESFKTVLTIAVLGIGVLIGLNAVNQHSQRSSETRRQTRFRNSVIQPGGS